MAVYNDTRTIAPARPAAPGSSLLSSMVASILHWNEARKTRNALSALTDRELHDIGLCRGDIEDVAR